MFFRFVAKMIWYIFCLIVIVIFTWLIVSWVDVLSHNSPITGDRNYWKYNAIIWMIQEGEIK